MVGQRLRTELAALSATTDWAAVLAQAAAFLRDLPAAWDAATPEQRNALARRVFQSVEIDDGRVVAVVPRPDFAPFFNLAEAEPGRAGPITTKGSRVRPPLGVKFQL